MPSLWHGKDSIHMTTAGRRTLSYPTSDSMKQGVEAMTKIGWHVESTTAGQTRSGLIRRILPEERIYKLLGRTPPGYTVTFFANPKT
jgi:hypothetical protein